jgi:hypothetical protein
LVRAQYKGQCIDIISNGRRQNLAHLWGHEHTAQPDAEQWAQSGQSNRVERPDTAVSAMKVLKKIIDGGCRDHQAMRRVASTAPLHVDLADGF